MLDITSKSDICVDPVNAPDVVLCAQCEKSVRKLSTIEFDEILCKGDFETAKLPVYSKY